MTRPSRGAVVLLLVLAAGCRRESPPTPPAEPKTVAEPAAVPKLCEHEVPADLCTRCTPELIEVYKAQGDWCSEHGLPESHCKACNPELTFTEQAAPADWCREHGLPESKCTKCHPQLVARFIEAGDYCREHGFPESACPICHPELVEAAGAPPPVFPAPGTRVRLASSETARDVGIKTAPVTRRPLTRTLEVVGQLTFDRNRHAELIAPEGARILEVKVDVGDEVKAGQPLVVLSSASVGAEQARLSAVKARLDAARATLDRETALARKGISSARDVEAARSELAAAQSEHDAARAALSSAGARTNGSGGRYVLTAPFSGTIVGRDAVIGRTVSAEQVLVQVADLATLWAELEIPEGDALSVRKGQKVTLSFEGLRGASREATIDRLAASVDPTTRTVRARVELPNPERSLKAGVFVRARIQTGKDAEALVVPKEAVQQAEGHPVVFVKKNDTVYEPVAVELGAQVDGWVEIVRGLSAGNEVVTTGAFLLKTEILKGSIGAGCCETGEE